MNRRTASGLLVAGGSAVVAAIVGIPPLIMGLSPAWQGRRESWRKLGPISDYPVGKVTNSVIATDQDTWPRSYGEQAVFVWRKSQTEFVVFSRSCTDLGCPLEHEPGSGCFLCPCHGGIFAADGQRLAGPPKSPMHRYAHRISDSALEIDLTSVPPAA